MGLILKADRGLKFQVKLQGDVEHQLHKHQRNRHRNNRNAALYVRGGTVILDHIPRFLHDIAPVLLLEAVQHIVFNDPFLKLIRTALRAVLVSRN